jgi:transposase
MMRAVGDELKVYLHRKPVDMRRGRNGLAALAREVMQQDVFSGALFLFIGRRFDAIKILYWDRNGFAVWYKVIESHEKFHWPRLLQEEVITLTNEHVGARIILTTSLPRASSRPDTTTRTPRAAGPYRGWGWRAVPVTIDAGKSSVVMFRTPYYQQLAIGPCGWRPDNPRSCDSAPPPFIQSPTNAPQVLGRSCGAGEGREESAGGIGFAGMDGRGIGTGGGSEVVWVEY